MKKFMDQDFLLDTQAARKLYHEIAADLPIFDYHCHLSPQEIAENKPFTDIADIWLRGDHYKWRIMRTNGADESLVTGKASWADKFAAFAAALEQSPGNPLVHWSHLELQRAYGINDVLTTKNALEIRDRANAVIRERGDTPRSLLEHFKVAVVCTTDDPADDLRYHKAVAADKEFGVAAGAPGKKTTSILPAFRPDKAMNTQDLGAWKTYIARLGAAADVDIRNFADLAEAISRRHEYFHANGCRLSDHAILVPPFAPASEADLNAIVVAMLSGKQIGAPEREKFETAMLMLYARLNAAKGWVMQLHIAALRSVNTNLLKVYGTDGGADAISDAEIIAPLAKFLDTLDAEGMLPKTILYSNDDNKHVSLAVLAQCYAGSYGQGKEPCAPGKMQYGAPWWFNDHLDGMERHLIQVSSIGTIGRWVGMLTDSRSFLSYPRHEYFRRILCGVAGRWVDQGLLPDDDAYAGALVRNVSWFNARDYFGMKVPDWAMKVR
ncbi:MAG: glucuronate isomerase [Spirochaetae bacterium HGW-Spirochaetae-9]|nr:MAG: glucuronate isomerase [Spirochaetae bacterium HGW-Spirochaetae-9]